jgi:purine nucleosidase
MAAAAAAQQMVIIDTDIGDDFDDASAVGLALSSPELNILGITSAWGDTALRAQLLDRLLCNTGRSDIPVAVGIEKYGPGQAAFTQRGGLPASRPNHIRRRSIFCWSRSADIREKSL